MEAWKEELYHWGVKGMKWGKRRKMSSLEIQARAAEGAQRSYDEAIAQKKRLQFSSKYRNNPSSAVMKRANETVEKTRRNASNAIVSLSRNHKKALKRKKASAAIKSLFRRRYSMISEKGRVATKESKTNLLGFPTKTEAFTKNTKRLKGGAKMERTQTDKAVSYKYVPKKKKSKWW